MGVKNIAVLGAGLMGSGIAQVCAQTGFQVQMLDVSEERLNVGLEMIKKSLGRMAKSGKLEQQSVEESLSRIRTGVDLKEVVQEADVVIEAVPENMDLKKDIFANLDKLCTKEAILATNTSELSVSAIASATQNPARVIGMHWFNPPPVMRLIEIVSGVNTSQETIDIILDFSHKLGKETVVVKDSQGFVTSRVLAAHMIESIRVLEEGVASAEDIDKAVKLGLNYPMGPLELADYVGLDTMLFVSEGMVEAFGDRFRAPQILRKLVEAGNHGRKTGKGFYKYNK